MALSSARRVYNLRRDDPNHPDKFKFRLSAPASVSLPSKATTSQWMGKIRDQGQRGSCTGQLGAEYRDWMYRKLYLWEKNRSLSPEQFFSSADFVYRCNLIADGDLGEDNGSTIHQTFVTLNQKGACLDTEEPYSDSTPLNVAPTEAQYAEALTYKGGPYHSVPDLATIKSCIASGYSVGVGISVYESFEGNQLSNTGFMPMPSTSESLLGGHAQHILDYDDAVEFPDGSKGGLFVQNSWGVNWGASAPNRSDRGCYWMPYAFVTEGYVTDCWMQHLGMSW